MSDISSIRDSGASFATGRTSTDRSGDRPVARSDSSARSTARFGRETDSVSFTSAPDRAGRIVSEPVRQDLVNRVRAEIKSGVYETDAKIDAAIESIMNTVRTQG